MSALRNVTEVQEKLEKMMSDGTTSDQDRVLDYLLALRNVPMSWEILSSTKIGATVTKLRKTCGDAEIVGLAKILIKEWRKCLLGKDGGQSASKPTSRPAPSGVARPADSGGETSDSASSSKRPKIEEDESTEHPSPVTPAREPDVCFPPPPRPSTTDACPPPPSTTKVCYPPMSTTDALRLKCRELLLTAIKGDGNYPDGNSDPEMLAVQLEEEIFQGIKNTEMKYKNRIRSRVANLRDPKNPNLRINFLQGSISSENLAKLTAEEMASDEMKSMREKFVQEAIIERTKPLV